VRLPPATHLVAGFEHRADAEQFLADLKERFSKFGLELHPDKTRLIEFGRKTGSSPFNTVSGWQNTFPASTRT